MNFIPNINRNHAFLMTGAAAATGISVIHAFLSGRITSWNDIKTHVTTQALIGLACYVLTQYPGPCFRAVRNAAPLGFRATRYLGRGMLRFTMSPLTNMVTGCQKYKGTVAGVITGFGLGALNALSTHSAFHRDSLECLLAPKDTLFGMINQWRESNTVEWPIYAAVSLFTLHNIINPNDGPGHTRCRLIWNTFTSFRKPSLNVGLLFASATLLRVVARDSLEQYNIDVSGHALTVIVQTYGFVKMQQACHNVISANQQRTISALLALKGVSDAVWTYQTITDCHSVMDVAAAIVLVYPCYLALHTLRTIGTTAQRITQQIVARPVNAVWNRAQDCFINAIDRQIRL